ncbi:MAG: hypothetical protein HQK58_14620 [Deltaproteobacteria bacterium]|nr:hypothetical protein [Deltaproteobacteria bacterium]
MAKKALVNYLHKMIDKFEQDGKPFNLVMLIPAVSFTGKRFHVAFSATWMDNMNDAIGMLLDAIREQMGTPRPAAYSQISTVAATHTIDPIVDEITEDYEVNKGSVRLPNCYINGNLIEGVTILHSNPPLALSNPTEPASLPYAQPITS